MIIMNSSMVLRSIRAVSVTTDKSGKYRMAKLEPWANDLRQHDFGAARLSVFESMAFRRFGRYRCKCAYGGSVWRRRSTSGPPIVKW
jgi:hypothetical protein